jgi:hypothetical protein
MKTISLILALLLPVMFLGQSAEQLYNSGIEKHSKKEYQGAIADYTSAVRIDPKLAVAWLTVVSFILHLRSLAKQSMISLKP